MTEFMVNLTGDEAKNYAQDAINEFAYANYQPLADLTDQQVSTMVDNLETFLQTKIGTPFNYNVSVKLDGVNASKTVDDNENITAVLHNIILKINITSI